MSEAGACNRWWYQSLRVKPWNHCENVYLEFQKYFETNCMYRFSRILH